jgi:tetratricopeptide (TPR) repeat protein
MNRLIALLLMSAVVASCSRDVSALKRRALEEGHTLLEQRNYPEAVKSYIAALRLDPEFGEAHLGLAEAHMRAGQAQKAIPEYIRAAQLMPDDPATQLKAGNLLLNGGFFVEAQNRARALLNKDPKNVAGLILLGNTLAGLSNLGDAVSVLERAAALAPERTGIYTNIGVFRLAQNDRSQAEAAFTKAVEESKGSPESLVGLGNFYRAVRRYNDAERTLKLAYSTAPKLPLVNDALASFYVEAGRPKEAETPLKALVTITGTTQSRYALASYYASVAQYAAALRTLRELTEDPHEFGTATTQIALIQYAMGKHSDAHVTLATVLARTPNDSNALTTAARLLLADNRVDEAYSRATLAVQADSKSAIALLTLGRVQRARRAFEGATRSFNEALTADPSLLSAMLELADLHLRRRHIDSAVEFAERAVRTEPSSLAAHLMVVKVLGVRSQDHGRADEAMTTLLKQFPDSAAVYAALGSLSLDKQDQKTAATAFTRALTLDSNSLDALAGLVAIDIASHRINGARARVDAMLAKGVRSAAPLLLAASVYTAAGDTQKVEEVLKRALELDPANPEAYGLLGQLYVTAGRLDEATKYFTDVARLEPHSPAAPTMLGLLAYAKRDLPEAQHWWERAVTIDPTSAAAANNLAWLYAENNENLDRALELARQAQSGFPDIPEINDTIGWIYYRRNASSLGIPYLEDAVAADPMNASFSFHLGLAYAQNGEDSKARKALQQALTLDPKFDGAQEARQTLGKLVF